MFAALSHLRWAWHAPPLLGKRVLVINGHPDPGPGRYCGALCAAYAEGARSSGWKTQRLDVGEVTTAAAESGHPSWLRNQAAEVLERLWLADRVFIAFPMWLGGPPPALQRILEEFKRWQDGEAEQLGEPRQLKKADIVVTAYYPGVVYRTNLGVPSGLWFTALSSLDIANTILIGSVESISREDRNRWLIEVRRLGSSFRGYVPGKAISRLFN